MAGTYRYLNRSGWWDTRETITRRQTATTQGPTRVPHAAHWRLRDFHEAQFPKTVRRRANNGWACCKAGA
jgi:hypothetical protein